MGIINVLDETVSNLIAAGEVVERPSSVIKELVENSVDAGAKNITVEIKNGGISYIRVTDDGSGIAADDVGVCFLRHATSKIKTKEDLSKIGTLGFRGEALCSVAAVSKVVLTTKTATAKLATKVYVSGGVMEDVTEAGAPNGTTIEVKTLFYNTPARMKFLKKDTTEAGYAKDVIEKFILAHPEISFKFISNGKVVFFSSGDGNLINAIYSVYGKDYAKSVIKVEYENDNMSVSGYIGKSNISRPNRAYQSFFVNQRSIKSIIMTKALEEAYKNQIMTGKFPFAVLNLKLNFSVVDVNVHPHKTEVKFSDERKVFDTVYFGVRNALYEKPIIPEGVITKKPFAFQTEEKKYENLPITEEKPKPFVKREEKPKEEEIKLYHNEVLSPIKQMREEIKENINVSFPALAVKEETKPLITEEKPFVEIKEEIKEEVKEAPAKEEEPYKISGSVFGTYIVVEKGDKMLLIDQHAAHERIKFEKIKASLSGRVWESQNLLVGEMIRLSGEEEEFLKENENVFKTLGFDFEFLGFNQVMINAVPMVLAEYSPEDVFSALLSDTMANRKNLLSEDYEKTLYQVACKAAVKANHTLSEKETESLVSEVFSLGSINTCPHGRPIIISFSKTEIEKQFKRIV